MGIAMFSATGAWLGGYSYSPYGEERSISAGTAPTTNSLRYIASYWDAAAGLYKLGARYYEPTTARFTQYDPTGQESNPYAYAACDPVNASDPTGLLCTQAVVAASLGGATAAFSIGAGVATGTIVGLPAGAVFGAAALATGAGAAAAGIAALFVC